VANQRNFCPFGCTPADLDPAGGCDHFIGWTEDGKHLERRGQPGSVESVLPEDRVVTTGVSARVYRQHV
jgi:hypothetical protein